MKLLKSSLVGAAALAFASAAMATVATAPHVYITGSTAFRGATMTAITNVMDSGYTYAYDGSNLTGSNRAIVYGTLNTTGHPEVTIKAYWSGSAAGVQTVSNSISTTNWMNDSTTLSTSGGTQAGTPYEAATPNVCMSDSAQGLTPYTSTALTPTKVGVIPFAFVKGRCATGHPMKASFDAITNINGQQAQVLIASGIDLAQLTGTAADTGNKVYVLGRNPESGTRLVTFAESGFGTTGVAGQVIPTTDAAGATNVSGVTTSPSTSNGQTILNINYYDAGTVNGIFADVGNNGFASGGTLGKVLSNPVDYINGGNNVDAVPFALIGYLGINDAATSIQVVNTTTSTDVSRILSYNGISLNPTYSTSGSGSLSWDLTPVKEGKYTFWSYEYLMYKTTLTGTAKTAADTIAARIVSADASVSGVLLSAMHCSRTVEGGVVTR